MSNNNVKEWSEFQKLGELQNLEDLVFVGKNKLGGMVMLWLTNPMSFVACFKQSLWFWKIRNYMELVNYSTPASLFPNPLTAAAYHAWS